MPEECHKLEGGKCCTDVLAPDGKPPGVDENGKYWCPFCQKRCTPGHAADVFLQYSKDGDPACRREKP